VTRIAKAMVTQFGYVEKLGASTMPTSSKKREDLERLAQGLLEYETLTGSEIQKVINGEPLNRGEDKDDNSASGGTPSITAVPKTRKPKADPEGGPEPDPTPAE
jgi:cell division protease FtsH